MGFSTRWSDLAIVRASWTKRLWLGAAGVAIFIATVWTAHAFSPEPTPHNRGFGLDFIAFYTAGSFVKDGRLSELYNLETVHQFQRELAAASHFDLGIAYGPWWNPPFYALVFEPLAKLPYPAATIAWIAINLICFAIACVLLCRLLSKQVPWRTRALMPILAMLSAPFILAISHAQNTCMSLLLLAATVTLWRNRSALCAGLVGGLLFYKPQLAALLALILVLDLGWRAVAGYAMTGIVLLAVNLIALPGTLLDYLHRLPENVRMFQNWTPYPWEQHITLKAFWRLLLQGRSLGDTSLAVTLLWIVSAAVIATTLLWATVRARRSLGESDNLGESSLARDRLIIATIVATPLLMPFYFDYDLLLLAVPATLFAAECLRRSHADRPILACWIALYIWQMINDEFAGRFHVNVSVLLITLLASISILRVFVKDAERSSSLEVDHEPLLRAA